MGGAFVASLNQELSFIIHIVQYKSYSLHFYLCCILTQCPRSVLLMSHSFLRMLSPDVMPASFLLQKLSPSPQQTQVGSVSSPHASQHSQEESSPCSDMSSYEEPPSPLSAASSGPLAPAPAQAQVPVHRHPSRASDQEGCSGRDAPSLCQRFFPSDPTKWNVEEVYEFIRSLPGQWSKHRLRFCSGNTLIKHYIHYFVYR